MSDIEREKAEKLMEIDKIKTARKSSEVMMYLGIPVGAMLLIMFFYLLPIYTSYILLIFGIGFIVMSVGGYYDVNYLFPRRLEKAEQEYEALRRQSEE